MASHLGLVDDYNTPKLGPSYEAWYLLQYVAGILTELVLEAEDTLGKGHFPLAHDALRSHKEKVECTEKGKCRATSEAI
jgi:hypothetical protein